MFTLTKLEWLVLAAALALCPGWSWAAELAAGEAKSRNWIAFDRDGDGRISRAEFGLVAAPSSKPEPKE